MFLMDQFQRTSHGPEVKPGESYRRTHGKGVTETVTVLDLRNDPLGIPHVRFSIRFDRDASEASETAQRILSLRSFRDVYRERLA